MQLRIVRKWHIISKTHFTGSEGFVAMYVFADIKNNFKKLGPNMEFVEQILTTYTITD